MSKLFFSCEKGTQIVAVSTNSKDFKVNYLEIEEPKEQLWSIPIKCPWCDRTTVFKNWFADNVSAKSGLDTLCRTQTSEINHNSTTNVPLIYKHTLWKERSESGQFMSSLLERKGLSEFAEVIAKENISKCRKHGVYISDEYRCPSCEKKLSKEDFIQVETGNSTLGQIERVKKVAKASESLFTQFANEMDDAQLLTFIAEGNKIWIEEFSNTESFGKKNYLNLDKGDLSGGFFIGGNGGILKKASLKEAQLLKTRWLWINLEKTNFFKSDLRKSMFIGCNAEEAQFREADLREAHINLYTASKPVDFTGADLRDAEILLGNRLPNLDHIFESTFILKDANLQGCKIEIYDKATDKGGMLCKFLESLSEEQKKQIILVDPSIKPTKSKCFIATAACGSDVFPSVNTLRKFRDERLIFSDFGRWFIHTYERVSPPVADWISEYPFFRFITRCIIVYPMVILVTIQNKFRKK